MIASVRVTRAAIRDGAPDDVAVDRFVDQRFEVFEAESLDHFAAERVDRPEGGDQQDRQRAEVADHQPADRAGEQRPHLQAGAAVEEAGEPAAHRPPRRDCFSRHRSATAALSL